MCIPVAIIEIHILLLSFPADTEGNPPIYFCIVLLIYIERKVTVEYVKGRYDLRCLGYISAFKSLGFAYVIYHCNAKVLKTTWALIVLICGFYGSCWSEVVYFPYMLNLWILIMLSWVLKQCLLHFVFQSYFCISGSI